MEKIQFKEILFFRIYYMFPKFLHFWQLSCQKLKNLDENETLVLLYFTLNKTSKDIYERKT